jgi:hypothetical protein
MCRKGYKLSDETRKKMSDFQKKRFQNKHHHNWRGGKHIANGYVFVWCPTHPAASRGYVREHRLVMEKHLGRLLVSPEEIHHINGVKTDNRIKNLELHKNHSVHISKERKARFWSSGRKSTTPETLNQSTV